MKNQPVLAALIKGATLDGYLAVKKAEARTASTGKKYLDMVLCDSTACMGAKVWDGVSDVPQEGSVIRVRCRAEEFRGRLQLRVEKYREAQAGRDDFDPEALSYAGPYEPEQEEKPEDGGGNAETEPAAARRPSQPSLASLADRDEFRGFLLVRQADMRTSSKGKEYLDMTLGDRSGEVSAKKWDGAKDVPEKGSVLYVAGMAENYNGRKQLRVDRYRPAVPGDHVEMELLVPCAPFSAEEMLAFIESVLDGMRDGDMRRLVRRRLDEAGDRLRYWPAASRLHHAEKGGLLHHTVTMLKTAKAVLAQYPFLDADLLFSGVILHDLCKLDEIDSDELGCAADYTAEGMLLGHLVMGVARLDEAGRELGTPREKLMMLEHMILSHHDLPEYGSPKPPMFPEAEVLHILDLLDARMFEMERELAGVKGGSFTDRIWSLDRRLYKRMGEDEGGEGERA